MKSLKEFDYDLWTTNENSVTKYWVRIKSTGEVTEVDIKTMRVLRNSEKTMRRQIVDEQENCGTILSLNKLEEDTKDCFYIFNNYYNHEDEIAFDLYLETFKKTLTEKQLNVFICCLINGQSQTDYAKENSINNSSVRDIIRGIRKKYKNFI